MSMYMDYLEGDERTLYIEQMKAVNEINKGFTLLEMVQMQYDQMCSDAELKVLTESGTYDDLEYLYKEAEGQSNEQSEGILKQIWNAIANFFKGIFNFLFGGKNKELPDDAEIDAPAGFTKACQNIANFFQNPAGNAKMIITAVFITGAAAIGIHDGVEKITKKEGELWITKITNTIAKAAGAVGDILSKPINLALSAAGIKKEGTDEPADVKYFFDKFTSWFNEHIATPFRNAIDKALSLFKKNKSDESLQIGGGEDAGRSESNSGSGEHEKKDVTEYSSGGVNYRRKGNKVEIQSNPEGPWQHVIDNNKLPKDVLSTFGITPTAPKKKNPSQKVKGSEGKELPVDTNAINKANEGRPDDQKVNPQDVQTANNNKVAEQKRVMTVNNARKDATKNGVTVGGSKYVLKGREVYKIDPSTGKPVREKLSQLNSTVADNIRNEFKKLLQDNDITIESTVDIANIRNILGENYLVELSEGGSEVEILFIGENSTEDILGFIFEDVVEESISTEESIFGILEESASTENDDNDLQELFDFFND